MTVFPAVSKEESFSNLSNKLQSRAVLRACRGRFKSGFQESLHFTKLSQKNRRISPD